MQGKRSCSGRRRLRREPVDFIIGPNVARKVEDALEQVREVRAALWPQYHAIRAEHEALRAEIDAMRRVVDDLGELDIDSPTRTALYRAGINRPSELWGRTPGELRAIPGIGAKRADSLRAAVGRWRTREWRREWRLRQLEREPAEH